MPTRRQKKRIRRKRWRPSRSASGRPPLTSMRGPMIRIRSSQTRKQRLLRLQVQSSSRPSVLVLSHPVGPLLPRSGQLRWQEAWVPGWLRLQDQRRSKSPLTEVFCLFLQSSVREASHSRLGRECKYMPLRARSFFCRAVISVLLCFAFRVLFELPSVHNCFPNLECARPRALRDIKKQFILQDKLRYNWRPTECHF